MYCNSFVTTSTLSYVTLINVVSLIWEGEHVGLLVYDRSVTRMLSGTWRYFDTGVLIVPHYQWRTHYE